MNTVTDTDKGFARIVGMIHDASKETCVTIGIHEEQGDQAHGELTVAQIAAVHEYGCPDHNIPQRSFIRDTHDLNLQANLKLMQDLEKRVLSGELTQHQALTKLGEVASKQMVSRINQGIMPKLKEATVKRKTINGKEGETPLVDSGQLKGSITFQVNS